MHNILVFGFVLLTAGQTFDVTNAVDVTGNGIELVQDTSPSNEVLSNKTEATMAELTNTERNDSLDGLKKLNKPLEGIQGLLDSNSTTAKEAGVYELPEEWTPFCDVGSETYESEFTSLTKLVSVRCHINSSYSGVWSMTDLRVNLDRYNDTTIKFAFDIECTEGANISLFWPMKVNNLFKLKVTKCLLVGFLSEYNNNIITVIPDSLRVLEMADNEVLISIVRFIEMLKNVSSTPKEYNCGHERTLEKLTSRNISFDFIEPKEMVIHNLVEIGEQFLLDSKRISHKCDYLQLTYLDESISSSMSIYHMSILTENSIYYELKTYNLSYNHIGALQDTQLQWSSYFPKLELYDLSHNNISSLYRFMIPLHARMDQITTIDLQHNAISSFTVQDLERFKQMPMVFIDLRNNPLFCNCTDSFKELLKFVHEKKYKAISNITDYTYIKDLQCMGPNSLKGKTLEFLKIDDLPCESETEYFVVPVVALSVTVVVLGLILFLVLRYRKEVMILMYTRFHIIVPCQSGTWDDDKRYDAFVSYSSNDEEFVESLFEKLEQPSDETDGKTFKFCLHHRDFVLGKTIFSNVCNSVESSRHTIILLSNSFIKSQFCLYEFQEAFRQSIMEKKRHLIIIMMEDVPADALPKDLRRCIKTFTYIRKDDYLFHDRLIYAMSIKQKSKSVNDKKHKSKAPHTNIALKTNNDSKVQMNGLADVTNIDKEEDKSTKSNRPMLILNTSSVINDNFAYSPIEEKLRDRVTLTDETTLSNAQLAYVNKAADVDYDRCISTGSADTGYSSDFIPSPTSTICSSPTYLKNGDMPVTQRPVNCVA